MPMPVAVDSLVRNALFDDIAMCSIEKHPGRMLEYPIWVIIKKK